MRTCLLLLVLVGCAPEIPEGRAACTLDTDCPTGWSCRRADRGGRCWRTPDTGDGGVVDGSTVDAAPIDATHVDAMDVDATNVDAGPCATIDCDDHVDCTIDTCNPGTLACSHFSDDADGDGHHAICMAGTMVTGDDCDDTRADVYPGAPELCDGDVDDDCDLHGELSGDMPDCEWLHCNAADDACDTPVAVAAGGSHVCVRTTADHVFCWGANDSGQLGVATPAMATTPIEVGPFTGEVDDIACGTRHTCAIDDRGVVCWGGNGRGELGHGLAGGTSSVPTVVLGTMAASAVGAGNAHTCAQDLTGSGTTYCWGANDHGQLGDTTTMDRSLPTSVTALNGQEPHGGRSFTCSLGGAGGTSCWGLDDTGQLEDGGGADRPSPRRTSVPPDALALATGIAHACIYRRNATGIDQYECWGANAAGQVGSGATSASSVRSVVIVGDGLVMDHSTIPHLAAGDAFTCATDSARNLHCWGANDEGQLGIGSPAPIALMPTLTMLGSTVRDVAAGGSFACALVDAGPVRDLRCWGANESGQLGNGSFARSDVPVRVVAHALSP